MLCGKRIILGVTGSIAAYKAADLASRLAQAGAEVTAVLTRSATQFVGPLTFTALTGREAVTSFTGGASATPHVELEKQADLILVAPATANILAKLAQGLADDVLCATILAATCPVVVAPAMHDAMWQSEATGENVRRLRARGVSVIDPDWGSLASGDKGWGRLPATDRLINEISLELSAVGQLQGKRLLVTAGGTREPFDAVRYLGNPASGKMGFALARETARRGGETVLVSGPSDQPTPPRVDRVDVVTAAEMREAVLAYFDHMDAVIMAAAVTDYRFKTSLPRKQQRDPNGLVVELVPNPDILAELGKIKSRQILVGFAAETGHLAGRASQKLAAKKLDFIVANDVSRGDAGFGADDNQATLFWADRHLELPLMSKRELARIVVDHLAELLVKARAKP